MTLFLANIWGWIVANPLRFALYVLAFLGVLFVISWFACGRDSSIKIDQEKIDKINKANEAQRRQELEAVITQNAAVVTTVDERNTIAETNVVERNRELDAKIAEVNQKIVEAKQHGRDITQSELQCLLVPSDCR